MVNIFSRLDFQGAVRQTKAERHARGFRSWDHFIALLFGQLAGQDSLRGVEAGMATQGNKLYHLGVKPVNRSTLSYANNHRPHELFHMLFYAMLSKCQRIAPKHKFRFKNPLYSIDTTLIKLCLSLFDWATFRKTKGAVKLHVKLSHAGYIPTFAVMTTGKVHEQRVAPKFPMEKGDVYVFDRAFNNFTWLADLHRRGITFITRMKRNAKYRVVKRRKCKRRDIIKADQIIEFTGFYSHQNLPFRLRRIVSKDPETGKRIAILTNQFSWAPSTIASVYKDRWQIEIFFKTIKQLLKIKSFLGTSQNALLSQLWVALCAYLLLSFFKFQSRFKWSLYTLSCIIPTNLFCHRDIWDWLNNPYKPARDDPAPFYQLAINFG
jgi:hypothetical protein